MNFSTKGHAVEEKSYVSSYLEPGIHVAKIQKVEFITANSGTQGVLITHEGKPMDELQGKGQTAETKYWMSEKAWPYTKDRLVIIADKLGVREKLDAIEASSAEEYAQALNSIFAGKAARWKFAGEEIAGKEGKKNWFKASLANFAFCEPLSVEESDSKLKFDEDDKYDMKRLEATDVETTTDSEDESPWG